MSEILTASRMRAARGCMRLHRYTYELGYRPALTAEALRFGTLVHLGLEAWMRSGMSLEAAHEAMQGESDPYQHVLAEEMIRGYHYRWRDAGLEILAVEVAFLGPLVNPETGRASPAWLLSGKIDAVVRDPMGRILIMEHKTSSEDITPGSDYWRRLRMDGQVSTYYDGAALLGYVVEGCLYDVLGKPALRPYKATPPESRKYKKDGTLYASQRLEDETPEEYRLRVREAIIADPARYYQRGEVVRLEEEMNEARADRWQEAGRIREARRLGIAPRNPDYCSKWNRLCDFFDVCTGVASLEDPARFVQLQDVHPELQEEANNG